MMQSDLRDRILIDYHMSLPVAVVKSRIFLLS